MAGAGVIMTRPGQPGTTLGTRGERVASHMSSDHDDDDDEMMMSHIIIVESMTDALECSSILMLVMLSHRPALSVTAVCAERQQWPAPACLWPHGLGQDPVILMAPVLMSPSLSSCHACHAPPRPAHDNGLFSQT